MSDQSPEDIIISSTSNLSSESSSLYPHQSASQTWNFNQQFQNKRILLQETKEKITSQFPRLEIRADDEYIEWNTRSDQQFQQWWKQTSIGESILNKT